MEVGGRGRLLYLSLHCHHQNDSCIKMGSDESQPNHLPTIWYPPPPPPTKPTPHHLIPPPSSQPNQLPTICWLRSCDVLQQSCDILVVLSYILLSANFRRRLAGLFRPLQRLVCCNRCRHQSSFASSVSGSQIFSTPHTTQMEMANSVTRG